MIQRSGAIRSGGHALLLYLFRPVPEENRLLNQGGRHCCTPREVRLSGTEVALAIGEHTWPLALGIPASIVLTALARAAAERIRTSTTICCGKAEDRWLKEMGVPARERRRRAVRRIDRRHRIFMIRRLRRDHESK